MVPLSEVVRQHGDKYISRYKKKMLPSHLKALRDIKSCQTISRGGHVYSCDKGCGHSEYKYHSCDNRSCNKCSGKKSVKWAEQQLQKILPVPYFHFVFTVPSELRDIISSNQTICYNLLLKCAGESICKLAEDPKYVGGKVGAITFLHTWSRDIAFHPHVHVLVPGVAHSKDKGIVKSRKNYILPFKPLSLIFKSMFLKRLRLKGIDVPQNVWKKEWVVDIRRAEQGGEFAIKYLARYVNKVALGKDRITYCDDNVVKFKYRRYNETEWKEMVLQNDKFLHRYLQHTLPPGFIRIRYYGLFTTHYKDLLLKIKSFLDVEKMIQEEEVYTNDNKFNRYVAVFKHKCPNCKKGILLKKDRIRYKSRGSP